MKTRVSDEPVDGLSLEDAQAERGRLVQEVADIQAQLGDRSKRGCVTRAEYGAWRTRAIHAMRLRQARMARLKDRIRVEIRERLSAKAKLMDTTDVGLLRSMLSLVKDLVEDEEIELSVHEQALVDYVRERVRS